jgi:hypothetical protein
MSNTHKTQNLRTFKVCHSRIITDVYEVQGENEEDAEFAWINDPLSFNVIDTFSENDQVEVQK